MTDHRSALNLTSRRIVQRSLGKEVLIAVVAVFTVALAVTNSGFVLVAICAGLAIAALLRFESFVYGLVFLLPWYPEVDLKPPFHDIFLILRFVLFAGVGV